MTQADMMFFFVFAKSLVMLLKNKTNLHLVALLYSALHADTLLEPGAALEKFGFRVLVDTDRLRVAN